MSPDTLAMVPELVAAWACIGTLALVAVLVVMALALWYQACGATKRKIPK